MQTKAGSKPDETEGSEILRVKTVAENQLKRYGSDKKFKKTIGKTSLIKIAMIFAGHKAIHIDEVRD